MTANTIACFKTRLDTFWNSQDVKFDYKQNLTELHNIFSFTMDNSLSPAVLSINLLMLLTDLPGGGMSTSGIDPGKM